MNDDKGSMLRPFVGELVGGSLRELRLEPLQHRMTLHGLDPAGDAVFSTWISGSTEVHRMVVSGWGWNDR